MPDDAVVKLSFQFWLLTLPRSCHPSYSLAQELSPVARADLVLMPDGGFSGNVLEGVAFMSRRMALAYADAQVDAPLRDNIHAVPAFDFISRVGWRYGFSNARLMCERPGDGALAEYW